MTPWMAPVRLLAVSLAGLVGSLSAAAGADLSPLRTTFNDHGATGLIQMPSGRMAADGTLAFGASRVAPYRRYFFTLQALPWLQGTFRWTDIAYRSYGIVDHQTYKDKGVDLKLRLLEEGPYMPELSVGLRDIGGTGLFSSEYVALSRRFGDFDVTAGLAWGNLGSGGGLTNPMSLLGDKWLTRPPTEGTGELTTGFFRGETVGPFAGIEWHTPLDGLRLKVEYDGNNYQDEPFGERLDVASAVNAAISYSPFAWLDLAAGWERGNTLMARAVLRTNLQQDHGVPPVDEEPPLPAPPEVVAALPVEPPQARLSAAAVRFVAVDNVYAASEDAAAELTSVSIEGERAIITLESATPVPLADLRQIALAFRRLPDAPVEEAVFLQPDGTVDIISTAALERRQAATGTVDSISSPAPPAIGSAGLLACVSKALDYHGFTARRAAMDDHRAHLVFSQEKYRDSATAIGRAARAMALCTPPDVLEFILTVQKAGLPTAQMRVLRRDIIRGARREISTDEIWVNAEVEAASPAETADWAEAPDQWPSFSWSLTPQVRQSLGGPDNFMFYQVYGKLSAGLRLTPRLSLSGSLGVDITNNFDNFSYVAPSQLPRVRTYITKYLTEGTTWLDSLAANYVLPIAPDLYGRVSGGLFEWMYGGVGGEILYAPTDQRWAVGLDLNQVWQRNFGGGFGFRDYSVLTGHLTWYHQLPWYDLTAAVSVGRYLAKDIGATASLQREFANGTRIGVYATKTDVSAAEYGEGSFSKGIFFSIPFDLFLTKPSAGRMYWHFSPLTRDGGQMVGRPMPLYEVTGARDRPESSWRELMR